MGSCGFQIPLMTSLPWLVLGWGQDPALRVFLDGLSGLSLLALWAVRSLHDTFQEPSGMGLGAEPAVDSCEEMAVRKWLLRLRSRTCCFCWEPHLHFSIFLKYVRAVQECILAITLLKADSEIDRVCCSCFISSQESPAPKTESFLWEVP